MKRSQIARTAPLRRGKGLAPVSAKRRREQTVRRRNMLAAFGDNPLCAIRWDERCQGYADAAHELLKRSRGGSITDPANCVPACHPCNSAVEDYPAEAEARGWSVPSWKDAT